MTSQLDFENSRYCYMTGSASTESLKPWVSALKRFTAIKANKVA